MRTILCLLFLLCGVTCHVHAQHTFKMRRSEECYLIRGGERKFLLDSSYDLTAEDTIYFMKKSENILRDTDLHKSYNVSNLIGEYLIGDLAVDVETDNRFTNSLKVVYRSITGNFVGMKSIGDGSQSYKNVSDTLQMALSICSKIQAFDSATNDSYSDFDNGCLRMVYEDDQNCYKVENTTSTGLFIDIICINNKKYSILNPSEKAMTSLFLPAKKTMMLDIALPEGKCVIAGTEIPLPFNALFRYLQQIDAGKHSMLDNLKVTFQIIKPSPIAPPQ